MLGALVINSDGEKKRKMPYLLLLVLLLMSFVPGVAQAEDEGTLPEPPEVHSGAAVLMDEQTGVVLYAKEPDTLMYPASITKIVTGIVALENSEPDEPVTVSEEARYEDGTRIFLSPGEQKPMGELLYGLLLNSGNDAATAIAEHIDGTKEKFAERMNDFVNQLDLANTHFANPHGLFDEDNYTTAKDMAVITKYAMSNPRFREIVATKTLPWHGKEWDSELVNHNKMLWRYDGATGVKNGYTGESGNTLVTTASRDGFDLIVVLLKGNSSEEIYDDATRLLDYGFEYMRMKPPEKEIEPEAQPAAEAFAPSVVPATETETASEPAASSPPKWPVTVPWLLMNLFMVMVAFLKWKKGRRYT
jgi:serine-type D-Ala-D-Ala carboxypeptidase (penicillin-binding protein 5/6)